MPKHYQISEESIITRTSRGLKLVNADNLAAERKLSPSNTPVISLADAMKLTFNFYMTAQGCVIKQLNDACLESTGFLSRKDAINSDLTKVCSDKAYIATVLANDELVMQTKKHHIYDEQLILINDCSLNTISVKLPWLDQDNKPIGIIGCSVKVQLDSLDSLAKNLTKITELFLSPTGITNSLLPPNSTINGIYYSPREIEVMEWVIHGKTMRDIGEILGISRRTAESYFINIKNKAGVDTKSDLIDFLLAHQ